MSEKDEYIIDMDDRSAGRVNESYDAVDAVISDSNGDNRLPVRTLCRSSGCLSVSERSPGRESHSFSILIWIENANHTVNESRVGRGPSCSLPALTLVPFFEVMEYLETQGSAQSV